MPESLVAFYKKANGIDLFSGALSISGLRRSFVRTGDEATQPFSIITPNVHERPRDAPEELVFFGFYNYDGSRLGMLPDSPTVFRFAPGSAKHLGEWPSFDEMLLSEVRRLSFMFDEMGRRIDKKAPTTPS